MYIIEKLKQNTLDGNFKFELIKKKTPRIEVLKLVCMNETYKISNHFLNISNNEMVLSTLDISSHDFTFNFI